MESFYYFDYASIDYHSYIPAGEKFHELAALLNWLKEKDADNKNYLAIYKHTLAAESGGTVQDNVEKVGYWNNGEYEAIENTEVNHLPKSIEIPGDHVCKICKRGTKDAWIYSVPTENLHLFELLDLPKYGYFTSYEDAAEEIQSYKFNMQEYL